MRMAFFLVQLIVISMVRPTFAAAPESGAHSSRNEGQPHSRSSFPLETIFFGFDQSNLDANALETLKRNARQMKNNPQLTFLLEGHCDERGTAEYNMLLGQRRAKAVAKYLSSLGVATAQIGLVLSYGEESPEDPAHDDAAWSKNRRVETVVEKSSTHSTLILPIPY